MANLTNPKIIWCKGILFAGLGVLASCLLIARMPGMENVALLAITIWAFCRAYYFAFYVIEKYVDPSYGFAGIVDFARYAILGHPPDRR
ncbi:hypothetical protein Poly51_47770 [Rubripirellula tenax]|uniref:Uncharacterized protein n=1 Tax=Rubripirellula tenax TaxID=2528015 RepID=A0A5C6EGC8_9BACT|nr:hypothetical protein [Rubripirellula tenax]TWU48873.1 hypothetical protein Poly51_47770 [Rubripirellula tenax]